MRVCPPSFGEADADFDRGTVMQLANGGPLRIIMASHIAARQLHETEARKGGGRNDRRVRGGDRRRFIDVGPGHINWNPIVHQVPKGVILLIS